MGDILNLGDLLTRDDDIEEITVPTLSINWRVTPDPPCKIIFDYEVYLGDRGDLQIEFCKVDCERLREGMKRPIDLESIRGGLPGIRIRDTLLEYPQLFSHSRAEFFELVFPGVLYALPILERKPFSFLDERVSVYYPGITRDGRGNLLEDEFPNHFSFGVVRDPRVRVARVKILR